MYYSVIIVKKIVKVYGFFLFLVLFLVEGGKNFMFVLLGLFFYIEVIFYDVEWL